MSTPQPKFKRGDIVQHRDGSIYVVESTQFIAVDSSSMDYERVIFSTVIERTEYEGNTENAELLTKIGHVDD